MHHGGGKFHAQAVRSFAIIHAAQLSPDGDGHAANKLKLTIF
ncbi:MAG: hypothetical protein ACTXOO_01265 [Sodalis sp. (in: enterobacteria)]